MSIKNFNVTSPANKRAIPLRAWIPENTGGEKYAVAMLLHGRLPEASNIPDMLSDAYSDNKGMQRLADAYSTVLCAPLCGNYAYCDSPVREDVRVARFLGEELPEFCLNNLPISDNREAWSICGFSMGGTGSINVAARHPRRYAVACNFGGNCDQAYGPRELGWKDSPAANVLGSYHTMPENYEPWTNFAAVNMLQGRRDVAIGLGCGVEDARLPIVRRLHAHLANAKLPNVYTEYPGAHIFTIHHIALQLSMVQILRNTLAEAGGQKV